MEGFLEVLSFVHNINRIRALEGELARTIKTIGAINNARVHLVLPNKSVFSREQEEARASIVLKLQGASRLSRHKVASIQHLVASAVSSLSPDRISIVDDRGTLLLKGGNTLEAHGATTAMDDARFEHERRLSNAIETLIARAVGVGKIRAEVTADIDFDRITESKEIFDPEGQVARQSSAIEDRQNAHEASKQAVSVGENIPQAQAEKGGGNQQKSNRTEENITFEISKTMRNHIHDSGGIKRLSVAVVVDGNYQVNAQGEETYQPRSTEEMDNITKLVRSAIGFDEKRGDQLEVINMRFAASPLPDNEEDPSLMMGFERQHIVRIIEVLLLVFFGMLFLVLVLKPLVAGIIKNAKKDLAAKTSITHVHGADAQTLSVKQEEKNTDTDQKSLEEVPTTKIDELLIMKQVEGKVRSSYIDRVNQLVDEEKEFAANVIRNWLHG